MADKKIYPRPDETAGQLKQRIGEWGYNVTQRDMTEPPGTGRYDHFFEPGIYVDVVSGQPLFSSLDKFASGCGWPAFAHTIDEDAVRMVTDDRYGMIRTEVRSTDADSHLGHVFGDGPKEMGGLRYCINSAALRFIPVDKLEEEGYGSYLKLFEKSGGDK